MPDLEEQLRVAGARWRAEQRDPVVDLHGATAGARSRTVLVGAGTGALAVVAIVVVVLFAGVSRPGPRVSVVPTTIPTRPPSTVVNANPDVIELSSDIVQPDVLAVDGSRLWVTGYAPALKGAADISGIQGPAHLQEIDAETGKLLGEVTLPDNSPGGLRVGAGAVWLSGQQGEESTELLKVDAATVRVTARIPGVKTGDLAVTPDAVWATDGVGGLRRIDPGTGRVVATIDLHSNKLYAAGWVVAGPVGVFVGNGYSGNIQRIDPATNTAGPEIHIARDLAEMVELNGSLWVERSDGTQLIEVRGGTTVARTIDLPVRGFDVASDGKVLWVGTESAEVMRVDPATGGLWGVPMPKGTRTNTVAADPATGAVWATSMTPTPRLLRVPTVVPPARPCLVRSCPPPLPTLCQAHQAEPSMSTGSYCGPKPVAGNGLGPQGECTGRETAPPCGPGMVPGHYYAYTLPGRCDGKLVLDGGRWRSTLPPTSDVPDVDVWAYVKADGKTAGFIAPVGAVQFVPDTGRPVPKC